MRFPFPKDGTDLPDDLHAHTDGRVAVAADEAQVRLAHQTLEMKRKTQRIFISYLIFSCDLNVTG